MRYTLLTYMGMKVDFVISCGAACRPAHYAQKLCLRKFSSPCDWMMKYSLKHFVEILSTEGKLMFQHARYDEVNKWVCDTDTGMISMHDFHHNQPLEDQLPAFYEKMVRRAKNTTKQISQSRSVGIIMNRKVEKEELIDFANSMQSLFPNCYFYIVNVNDIPYQKFLKTEYTVKAEHYTVTEISFDDAHKNGRDKQSNPAFWLGNVRAWNKLMLNHFHVRGSRCQYITTRLKQKIKRGIELVCNLFKKA